MKRKLVAAALIAITASAIPPVNASAWTCGAQSATGARDAGYSSSLYRAKRIALAHCALHTPRGFWCFVTACG